MKILTAITNLGLGVILALLIIFVLQYMMGALPSLFVFGVGFMCSALMFVLNPIDHD